MADTLVDDLKRALGDAYTIERELTGGGMSRVFVAKEHALGREVVIKVLPPDLAAGVNRERFRREVQLAARLSHPYIVPLLHAGEHGELLWFTMPFIAGESLRTRLQNQGALKLPEVLKLLHDVVEALAYAHSHGVIHRDIKPANILSDGRHALVTDFGVAKALNAALPLGGPGHTTSGMAIGTPAYMAPEQLAADPEADHRVDIYAVGLLAYELLSGVSPFAAPSPTATMTAQLTRIPRALHELHPDIPPAFSDLVQHCLAKSPEDRPPDAHAILTELDRISGALAADVHRSTSGESAARARASAFPLVFATLGVVALIGAGFWWMRPKAPLASPVASADSSNKLGTDSDLSLPLPAKAMTHKDSLKLLEDLRQQLGQADPKTTAPKTAAAAQAAAAAEQASLEQQVARTDSLIRARMREFYVQRAPTVVSGGGAPVVVAPTTPSISGNVNAVTSSSAGTNAPHRLRIIAMNRERGDTALLPLQRRAAVELAERASRGNSWTTISIDSGGGRGGPPSSMQGPQDADVLVFLALQHESPDSVKLAVSFRSTDPTTNFPYRSITSEAVYKPTNTAPFGGTLNDAVRFLRQVRQLPAGQVWTQDMGRGGRGGPNDGGFQSLRNLNGILTSRQMDSARKILDSMRLHMPPRRKPDSLP